MASQVQVGNRGHRDTDDTLPLNTICRMTGCLRPCRGMTASSILLKVDENDSAPTLAEHLADLPK